VPVPLTLKLVLVPDAVLTVIAAVKAPLVCGLKVIVPVTQVPADASALFAVQVPKGSVKLVALPLVKGVAPNVTGPPLAVKVTVVQLLVKPTAVLGQETGTVAAMSVPKVVAVKVADPVAPVVGVTVTVLLVEPAPVGLNMTAPVVQVEPVVKI
jgi:hypothetical protein